MFFGRIDFAPISGCIALHIGMVGFVLLCAALYMNHRFDFALLTWH